MSRVIVAQELIEKFHEAYKAKYPHISKSQFDQIVRAEFLMMKKVIEDGALEEIRLQYLFVLKVSPQRVIKQLKFMSNFNEAFMSKERHDYYLNMMLKYIKENKSKFKKYGNKIKQYTGLTVKEISARKYPDNGHRSTT